MLKWIKSFFVKESQTAINTKPEESDGFYTAQDMLIYHYWNGSKVVKADPMILWTKLMDVWPEMSVDIKLASSQHSEAKKGREALIEKARGIFDIPPLTDQGGLTGQGMLNLLNHFMKWCKEVKKN